MKEFIEIVKKLWQNKRTRAIAILIVYFLFFLFVFSFISNTTKPDNSTDEFSYLNDIEIINYYVYDTANNIIDTYDESLVSGKKIYLLVKNSKLESTNYIDNSNTYYISAKDYEKIINNYSVETDGDIRIIVSDNKIVLDFTNYYGYKISIDIRS